MVTAVRPKTSPRRTSGLGQAVSRARMSRQPLDLPLGEVADENGRDGRTARSKAMRSTGRKGCPGSGRSPRGGLMARYAGISSLDRRHDLGVGLGGAQFLLDRHGNHSSGDSRTFPARRGREDSIPRYAWGTSSGRPIEANHSQPERQANGRRPLNGMPGRRPVRAASKRPRRRPRRGRGPTR